MPCNFRTFLIYWFSFIFVILLAHYFSNRDWIEQERILESDNVYRRGDFREALAQLRGEEDGVERNVQAAQLNSILEEGSGDDDGDKSGGIDAIDLTGGNLLQYDGEPDDHQREVLAKKSVSKKKSKKKSGGGNEEIGITTLGGAGIYVTGDLHQDSPEELEYISQIKRKLNDIKQRDILNSIHNNSKVYDIDQKQPVLVYYNRIPKCGSTSLSNLLNATGTQNGKFTVKYEHYRGIRFSFKNERGKKVFNKDMQNLVNAAETKNKAYMYIRHQYFTDMRSSVSAKDSGRDIVYMNMVRDPVERFISEYYYHRHGSLTMEKGDVDEMNAVTGVKSSTVNETIDKCVERRRSECFHDIDQTLVKFFCGQSTVCLESSDSATALAKAKHNLLSAYQYIGVSERYEDSIRLLEAMLPEMFKGIYKLYMSKFSDSSHNQTSMKKAAAELTKRILRKMLRNDVDLYEMIRFLFHEQFQSFSERKLL